MFAKPFCLGSTKNLSLVREGFSVHSNNVSTQEASPHFDQRAINLIVTRTNGRA